MNPPQSPPPCSSVSSARPAPSRPGLNVPRIRSTYLFLRTILSLAAEERSAVKRVVAASAEWRPDSIAIRSAFAPPSMQDVIAEITQDDGDGSHGFARRRRTGVLPTIRMHAYLVGLLRAQGVLVQRLGAAWQGDAEAFTVDSLAVAPFIFEGHRTTSVTGRWSVRPAAAGPGWFYVPTSQRLGVFAAYLLEPGSEDGFATWNYLDRDLRRGEEAPILRLASAPGVPLTLVE